MNTEYLMKHGIITGSYVFGGYNSAVFADKMAIRQNRVAVFKKIRELFTLMTEIAEV